MHGSTKVLGPLIKMRESGDSAAKVVATAARGGVVRVAFVGRHGIVSVVNGVGSVAEGNFLPVLRVPERRELRLTDYAGMEECTAEYVLKVCAGYASETDLSADLQGKMKPGERYTADVVALGDILRRPTIEGEAVGCMVLCVSALELMECGEHLPDDARMALRAANAQGNLQCFLAVTHVEEYVRERSLPADHNVLLYCDGVMEPLYAKARSLGFDGNSTVCIGFLDDGDTDFGDATDARVVVLKYLLQVTARVARVAVPRGASRIETSALSAVKKELETVEAAVRRQADEICRREGTLKSLGAQRAAIVMECAALHATVQELEARLAA